MARNPKRVRRAQKALDRGMYVTAYFLARSYCGAYGFFGDGYVWALSIMKEASDRETVRRRERRGEPTPRPVVRMMPAVTFSRGEK